MTTSGRSRTPVIVETDGHFRESCGCDYCQHPDWCGGDSHDPLADSPLWPCPDILALNGMTTAEEFHEAEAAPWMEWAQEAHPEWFADVSAPSAAASLCTNCGSDMHSNADESDDASPAPDAGRASVETLFCCFFLVFFGIVLPTFALLSQS